MSYAEDWLSDLLTDVEDNLLGESFTYLGTTYKGILAQQVVENPMLDAGEDQVMEDILVATRSQFGNITPAIRGLITYQGIQYSIRQIYSDAAAYHFTLKKIA